MIEHLELRHWRAFDHVGIRFQPGTTFLVAPNGVGKTSLLLGLTWALFGEHSRIDAKTCVRLGHDEAQATVVLTIGTDRALTIRRTVTTAGKTTSTFTEDDSPIGAADAQRLLEEEFGAPIEIAARLSVIRGSGKDDGELQLREHLYDAFGVSGLRRAAATAAKLNKDAVATRKRLRSETRSQLKDRDQLVQLASKLQDDLNDLGQRREPLAAAVATALRAQAADAAWDAYEAAALRHNAAVVELLGDAAEAAVQASDLADLRAKLTHANATIVAATDEAQAVQSEARAQVIAAQAALGLLEHHEPSCPTCARPFHSDELTRAIDAQRTSLSAAVDRIDRTEGTLAELGAQRRSIDALAKRADGLRAVEPPAEPRPDGDPTVALTAAQDALRIHDELAGSVAAERNAIVGRLDDDAEVQAAVSAERAAWRREALTQAAVAALTSTAEQLAKQHIEPLSEQVRWRWKALFGEDGLQLRPDGSIVRQVGDRVLPWSDLSSGEQLWARLAASLLVLRSSTTVPFAWLDEPLEHLDPRARRIVAADLASATRSGRPAQMIVTTYEHTLARQLANDLPDTHVRHIHRTELFEPPPRRASQDTDSGQTRQGLADGGSASTAA